ncbi:MAG TPA: metallophosphoesterase family protein [Thermodesulfobacteriota bacterium]
MRVAVVSDLHANLEAVRAVFDRIDALGIDRVVCLGDVVGYNANPNEVVAELRRRGIPCVQGNHDAMAASDEPPAEFSSLARGAILWTRRVLAPEHRRYLGALPGQVAIGRDAVGVHGAPSHRDRYVLSVSEAVEEFEEAAARLPRARVVFFGHTHLPIVFREHEGRVTVVWSSRGAGTGGGQAVTLDLAAPGRYLVNPGGVGQPRDGLTTAPFAIYDDTTATVRIERVAYDIEACAAAIERSGLDRRLAERLRHGW